MTYGLVCVLSGDVRSGKLTAWLKFLHTIDARFTNVYLVDNSGSEDFFQELTIESIPFANRFEKISITRFHKLIDAEHRASAMVSEDVTVVVNDREPVYADVVHKAYMQGSHVNALPIPPEPVDFSRPISSFCTVATYNCIGELDNLIRMMSFQHVGQPLIVFCDEAVADHLAKVKIDLGHGKPTCHDNLEVVVGISKDYLDAIIDRYGLNEPKQLRWPSVQDPNPHRPEIIVAKMAAMRYALKKYDDTMFLDCDVIPASHIFAPRRSHLALSPHFNTHDKEMSIGRYNAGMVWTDDDQFPEWWEHGMMEDSLFFEQECLNRVGGTWKVAEYPETHNYGFWRMYSLGKSKRLLDIPEICRALKLGYSDLGPTIRGNVIQSWHVHPYSNKDGDVALTELMKYLLRNSVNPVSSTILEML